MLKQVARYRYQSKRKRSSLYEKKIDWHLSHLKMIRSAVKDARDDYIPQGNSVKPLVKDPTASKAIAMATEVSQVVLPNNETVCYPERWMKLYDIALTRCDDTEKRLIKQRYERGVSYTMSCLDLSLSASTYYYILRSIIKRITPDAVLMGLIVP